MKIRTNAGIKTWLGTVMPRVNRSNKFEYLIECMLIGLLYISGVQFLLDQMIIMPFFVVFTPDNIHMVLL